MTKWIIFFLFLCHFNLSSQTFEDLNFGTDQTLEIVTWNLEWFPKEGQLTVNNVKQILDALDVDIVAFQEIDELDYFDDLVDGLEGYESQYVEDEYYSGLAYIYKTSTIDPISVFEVYPDEWREFPRAPLVFQFNYQNQLYIVINNHLKCCGDGVINFADAWDEEKRRVDANILLEELVSDYFPTDKVFIVGDMNDLITETSSANVFQVFLSKPEEYLFADMEIAQGTSEDWSFPSWPSHLDHILICSELFPEFYQEETVTQVLKPDEFMNGGWDEYDDEITDHRPVGIKLISQAVGVYDEDALYNFQIYPNPADKMSKITFSETEEAISLSILNPNGRLIQNFALKSKTHSFQLRTNEFTNGLYFLEVTYKSGRVSRSKLVVSH